MSSSRDATGTEIGWPWTFRVPADGGLPGMAFAPERLWQPINPGWSVGNVVLNTLNSNAPEVEQAIVARYSYGRQIGTVMEALQALVADWPEVQHKPEVAAFVRLAKDVATAKSAANASQLERLRAELRALKAHDRAAWDDIVKP